MNLKTLPLICLLLAAGLAGCFGGDDDDAAAGPEREPTFDNPSPPAASGLEHVAQLAHADGTPFASGAGIWTYGDLVFGSALGSGFFIADISDPLQPVLLWNATTRQDDESQNDITTFARDADVVEHPDGRLTLVLATQWDGMHIWDVTDPSAPEFLARTLFEDEQGNPISNHNIATVPGTQLVFNSRSGGAGSINDLVDLSDPSRPVVVGGYGTHGCHDISFFGSPSTDKFRGYCAGIDRTEIWNLDGFDVNLGVDAAFGIELTGIVDCPITTGSDPTDINPAGVLSCVEDSPVAGNDLINDHIGYPLRTLHHLALVNEDATLLVIGDEHNGGGTPGVCLLYDQTTGTSTPLGALWFYDISDETAPELLSWISPPTIIEPENLNPDNTDPNNPASIYHALPSCTAHFGTFIPGEDKFVIAWYNAGVLVIDLTDPSAPRIMDQEILTDIFTWDARVHNGYVFTGDIARGMDVFRIV